MSGWGGEHQGAPLTRRPAVVDVARDVGGGVGRTEEELASLARHKDQTQVDLQHQRHCGIAPAARHCGKACIEQESEQVTHTIQLHVHT